MPAKTKTADQADSNEYFTKGRFHQPFAPVPASILRSSLSDAAKLTWGRLAQFTNKADFAFPLISTLAEELRHSRSKVERSIRELKKRSFLEVVSRPGHSNLYRLRLAPAPPKPTKIPSRMKGPIPSPVTYIKDNSLKDQRASAAPTGDLEALPANCNRNLQADALSQRLEKYFGELPTKRLLEDVRAAARQANGAPVGDQTIIEELDSLERIYPRRSRKGPRYWSWFPVTLGDRFAVFRAGREARELPPSPPTSCAPPVIPDFLALDEE